jgi:hypothetical protein
MVNGPLSVRKTNPQKTPVRGDNADSLSAI